MVQIKIKTYDKNIFFLGIIKYNVFNFHFINNVICNSMIL
jgi:hypothetical protein